MALREPCTSWDGPCTFGISGDGLREYDAMRVLEGRAAGTDHSGLQLLEGTRGPFGILGFRNSEIIRWPPHQQPQQQRLSPQQQQQTRDSD